MAQVCYATGMNSALDIINADPKLVFELAAGVDSLETIAERYELEPTFLREIMSTPRMKRVLSEKRKELDDAGYTLAAKAKLCFEDLLGDVYKKAKQKDASLAATLSAAEFFRKVAGLDKKDVEVQQERFSITINLAGAAQPQTVTLRSVEKGGNADVVDVPSLELPAYILPDSADINSDLAYAE